MKDNASSATDLLRSLANERRLLILCQLVDGERSVGALAAALDLPQSSVSQQLANLRKDNLVQTRREAQTVYYALSNDEAARIIEVLHDIFCGAPAQ